VGWPWKKQSRAGQLDGYYGHHWFRGESSRRIASLMDSSPVPSRDPSPLMSGELCIPSGRLRGKRSQGWPQGKRPLPLGIAVVGSPLRRVNMRVRLSLTPLRLCLKLS
jgi:hypothetical protein